MKRLAPGLGRFECVEPEAVHPRYVRLLIPLEAGVLMCDEQALLFELVLKYYVEHFLVASHGQGLQLVIVPLLAEHVFYVQVVLTL